MIDPARRKELIRKVGFGRITGARDLKDTWSRRRAAMAKPAVIFRTALIASISIVVAGTTAACAVVANGYSLVPQGSLRLARLVEDLVPDVATLSEADLRIRFRSASRAIVIIDQTIAARPVNPSSLTWFERVFGTPAPQVDPGREAALLGIVDHLARLPIEQRADAIDNMMQWAFLRQNQEVWKLMKHIGEQQVEVRRALLGSNADALRQILAWLHERQGRGPEIEGLTRAIEIHRRELADELMRMSEQNRSIAREAEILRGRRIACRKQSDVLTTCLARAPR